MATAKQPKDTSANHDPQKPNHMIFWLDAHIGNPTDCVHLKKAFGSNTDPRQLTRIMLKDKEYDAMIASRTAMTVSFEGVVFLLQAFNNEDDCLAAFEQNQDKRIFFITSGAMGKDIVPKIIERYRPIFTDRITDQPYPSVYVFCLHIEYHLEWAMEYIQYVQMFTTESELLERMTRDIAEYFIERGSRLREDNDLIGALQRLHWAKKLWHQYDKMQQDIKTDDLRSVRLSQRMSEINILIAEVKAELPNESSDDENASSDDDGKGREPE
jgi:hypothetical protein